MEKGIFFDSFLIFPPNLAFQLAPVKSFYPINYNPKPLAMKIGGEAFISSSSFFWSTQKPSNKRKSLRNRKQKRSSFFGFERLID
jgi:hypothetical protein